MDVFALIVLSVILFWVIASLRTNGSTGQGNAGESQNPDYIPSVMDGLVRSSMPAGEASEPPVPAHRHHHTHGQHGQDPQQLDPNTVDSGFDPGHSSGIYAGEHDGH